MRPLRLSRVLLHLFSRFLAIETMYCSNCPSDSSDQLGMRCRRSSGVRPIFVLCAAPPQYPREERIARQCPAPPLCTS
uniref:Putative secreted peptide n=1 Tax=Anopheles braziliensis TaxID=58242 RepID=A0A2M3ZWL1_9DIPT